MAFRLANDGKCAGPGSLAVLKALDFECETRICGRIFSTTLHRVAADAATLIEVQLCAHRIRYA